MAIINMELKDTATPTNDVTVINASAAVPVTVDFSPRSLGTTLSDILNNPVDPLVDNATYDEYIITPLYMELILKATFHVPSVADEAGYSMMFSTDGNEEDYRFRFYFNPVDNNWRRDISVYLSGIQDGAGNPDLAYPDGWYWMRRALETGTTTFLIIGEDDGNVLSPSHPISGAAPESIIDLFDNSTFWGSDSDYDDPSVETVIDSNNDNGGLNAVWDAFTFNTGDTIEVIPVITDTMNFWYETNGDFIYTDLASDDDVIDFGPDYNGEKYGDWGFHPFIPSFTVTSTAP